MQTLQRSVIFEALSAGLEARLHVSQRWLTLRLATVSLTQPAGRVIVGAFLMNAALTTQTLTPATTPVGVVPRGRRMSWLAVWIVTVTGRQEKQV